MSRHPLSDIPEIVNLAAGRGLVRIPMEQDVPFTARVSALVDTAEFQRLRHISQLGLASLVYPGATHTRFEHALGVYHNALRYLWQLGKDLRFAAAIGPHEAEVLICAALLHDLGHWPFCHPIEDMGLPDLPAHESFAAEFLAPDGELAEVLRGNWRVEPEEVLDVLVPQTDSPGMRLMRSILSGPIDIDKMDYLDRDSLHAGVPYGRNFDRNRLIQSLVLNEAGDGLALSSKGRTAAELMVFARYVMFSEVYWHHAVRAATAMFGRAFFALYRDLDLRRLFMRSESEFIADMRRASRGTQHDRLVEGVFGPQRRLYKRVAEYSLYQSGELFARLSRRRYSDLVQVSERLADRLSGVVGDTVTPADILIDAQPPDREIEIDVPIFYPKEGIYRGLDEVSPVIAVLARTQFDDFVKRVRIFVHPRLSRRVAEVSALFGHVAAAVDGTGAA